MDQIQSQQATSVQSGKPNPFTTVLPNVVLSRVHREVCFSFLFKTTWQRTLKLLQIVFGLRILIHLKKFCTFCVLSSNYSEFTFHYNLGGMHVSWALAVLQATTVPFINCALHIRSCLGETCTGFSNTDNIYHVLFKYNLVQHHHIISAFTVNQCCSTTVHAIGNKIRKSSFYN